jgi:Protein kinase domain
LPPFVSSRLVPDSVIAGFRVRSWLGAGSMGSVYLAEDMRTGERVALKVMAAGLAEDERFRQRFVREAALAATLDHPHIVRTVASGEVDGLLFLAMAYVEGSDLRDVLQREGRLEPARALRLATQAAAALDAAHAAGLVHRDVKPGNILIGLGPEGEHAYVCDFGLARHVSSVSSLTGDRGFVGTIDYVPPEQIEGGTVDRRTDVYSLGCVLFECLAGARPFARESELSVVFAHLNEPPARISELRPELPGAFDEVFSVALAKAPEDRYQKCGELAEAALAASRGQVLARRKSRRRWLQGAAILAAAASAALAGFLVTRGGHSAPTSPTGQTGISQTAIAGTALGRNAAYYEHLLGPYRETTLQGPGYPTLAFQEPQMAVYFPRKGAGAIIITTWNRGFRTDRGIGPCSTIAALKKAYGSAVKASEDSIVKHGIAFGYVVGNNLFFATNLHTIIAVGLYHGTPGHTGSGSAQAIAGFVASSETACIGR